MLELNNLYNMDCMEGMAGFPDGYFDLAIVDPPYGIGSITYMPHKRTKTVGGFVDDYNIVVATLDINQRSSVKSKHLTDVIHSSTRKVGVQFGDENVAPPPEYFAELFRVSKNQIIWSGNNYILPPSRCFIVWRKTTVPEKFSMAMCEYAWTSFNDNAKWIELPAISARNGETRIHPTQKSAALYKWILEKYAKPGDKILDTHAGSASSYVAALDLGFDYVGFEMDKGYFDVARERIGFGACHAGV
jgi:site-specific DNA-methyltransferase (adenine-specific)